MEPPHLQTLKQHFSGQIILPGDSDYDKASSTLMSKGAPALVVRPKDAKDVAAAIKYASDNSLLLSVKSGGHSGLSFSTNTGGLVIDLASLNQVEIIDLEKRLVRVGAGAVWVEVAQTLAPHHLAISSGDTKTVGVGGLTLGGGIGWMVRKVGLALDNLVGAEIVTADGQILHLSQTENPELFWAIRGGGGNFGVVTSFEFVAHPVPNVFAGTITYSLENVSELLTGWRDIMRSAPEELTTMVLVMPSFGGNPPMFMIMCCFAGDDEATAMKALEPLQKLGKLVKQDIKSKEYVAVLEEAHPPQGIKVVAKDVFVKDFSDQLIAEITTLCQASTFPVLQIRSLGGALNRVASNATAFAHRDAEILLLGAHFIPLTAAEAETQEILKPWRKLATFGSGVYANLLTEADDHDLAEAYPASTYERLAKVKKQYDPGNLFNQNFNIKPAA
jgi:FAD/FMN-containing dehydrogenase